MKAPFNRGVFNLSPNAKTEYKYACIWKAMDEKDYAKRGID